MIAAPPRRANHGVCLRADYFNRKLMLKRAKGSDLLLGLLFLVSVVLTLKRAFAENHSLAVVAPIGAARVSKPFHDGA